MMRCLGNTLNLSSVHVSVGHPTPTECENMRPRVEMGAEGGQVHLF